eukprot:scaffold4482_cov393-Prasinococcus_capsulatus_cf.AAC.2
MMRLERIQRMDGRKWAYNEAVTGHHSATHKLYDIPHHELAHLNLLPFAIAFAGAGRRRQVLECLDLPGTRKGAGIPERYRSVARSKNDTESCKPTSSTWR